MLENVRVVLVETSHPGNIGAAARAMKTMGLRRLVLVNPIEFPCAEATARASGADDLLASAEVVRSLDDGIRDCRWVVGASARLRSIPVPLLSPRAFAEQARSEAEAGEIALVLGRERSGLSNEELDRCHALVNIPASEAYPSLNLAAALQVLAYELRVSIRAGSCESSNAETSPLSTAAEMEGFFGHLEMVMTEIDFLDPDNPKQLKRRLRRLFQRARPDQNEMNILRGILTATQNALAGDRERSR